MLGHLFLYGGFAYCRGGEILAVHAVTTSLQGSPLVPVQFGKPVATKVQQIPRARLQETISPYFRQQGAKQYCWLNPGESLGGWEVTHGGFAYLMEIECSLLVFPVV